MKAALLSACLAAQAAGQQPNRTDAPGPCTNAPQSTNCGFTGVLGTEDIHTRLENLYEEVFRLTGITSPRPPIVYVQVDSAYPAASRHAGGRRDNPGFEMAVTQHLCEIAHSEDEVAVIFAHELGHYAHGDQLRVDGILDRARAACGPDDADCVNQRAAPERMSLENAADMYAVDKLTGSRFEPLAAVSALRHYCDLRWALGLDLEADVIHLPLSQRAEAVQDRVRASRGSPAP